MQGHNAACCTLHVDGSPRKSSMKRYTVLLSNASMRRGLWAVGGGLLLIKGRRWRKRAVSCARCRCWCG